MRIRFSPPEFPDEFPEIEGAILIGACVVYAGVVVGLVLAQLASF